MKDLRIHFNKNNLFEITLIGVLLYVLWSISSFLLVLGVALIVSTFIEDFVVRFQKYHVPRVISVILFYIIATLIFVVILVFVLPILTKEILNLAQFYPEVQIFIETNTIFTQFTDTNININNIIEQLQDESVRNSIFSGISTFFGGIFNLIVIFIVSFYLSISQNGIDQVLRIFTPLKYKESVISIWHRVQKKIGSWFRGQLMISLILIIFTYIGLALFGIPYSFLLALLAGVFGLVPYGIFLALLPAAALGIGHGGIWMGVGIIIFYFILQQILDIGLQPLIVKKLTGVPPLVVIISVIVGAKLFGFYGLLLAIPLALFAMEIIAESEKQKLKQHDTVIEHKDITIIDKK